LNFSFCPTASRRSFIGNTITKRKITEIYNKHLTGFYLRLLRQWMMNCKRRSTRKQQRPNIKCHPTTEFTRLRRDIKYFSRHNQ
jgi:hypothetical protein